MLILIVEDEQEQREMLQGFLEKQGYKVLTASGGNEALELFESMPVQLVLLDHRMDDMNGDEVLEKMRAVSPLLRAIMITAYGDVTTAVKVMQLGADDFMEKPVDLTDLIEKIRRIEQSIAVQEESGKISDFIEQVELPITIIGSSEKMQELLSLVYRVASTEWSVLIRGETGTGKELIAKLIHMMGLRKDGPFVEVNCAAIPESLFESELFGHEKGALPGLPHNGVVALNWQKVEHCFLMKWVNCHSIYRQNFYELCRKKRLPGWEVRLKLILMQGYLLPLIKT